MERSSQAFRDLSDEEIEALVQSLNSLHEGELGVDMLVACGIKAITPLQRFLLQGKPSGIFVPRQRAVRALAELGAKDVLLDYLASAEQIVDPVAAHGEEAGKKHGRTSPRRLAHRGRFRSSAACFAAETFGGSHRNAGRVPASGGCARVD